MLDAPAYQLDLITPGSSPFRDIVRKQMRQMPNWRMYARGRPQMGQRLYVLTLNFGVRFDFAMSDFLANVASFISRLALERHAHQIEECTRLIICLSGRDDGDVHAFDLVNLVIIDFRKNDVLLDAESIVSAAIESFG